LTPPDGRWTRRVVSSSVFSYTFDPSFSSVPSYSLPCHLIRPLLCYLRHEASSQASALLAATFPLLFTIDPCHRSPCGKSSPAMLAYRAPSAILTLCTLPTMLTSGSLRNSCIDHIPCAHIRPSRSALGWLRLAVWRNRSSYSYVDICHRAPSAILAAISAYHARVWTPSASLRSLAAPAMLAYRAPTLLAWYARLWLHIQFRAPLLALCAVLHICGSSAGRAVALCGIAYPVLT
jgi:hypothetical protein